MSESLSQLHVGAIARVVGYREDSTYSARLLRLGLIPGTKFKLQRRAPLGDPVEIRFRGYSLVLRPAEADCLLLDVVKQDEDPAS
jgi:ferrous iron transport protein A